MTIPTSDIASGVAQTSTFANDTSGASVNAPQHIAVFAQGATANTYATTKRRVTSHQDVGAIEGWGSPAHSSIRELFPDFGGGVGSIIVTLYPLPNDTAGAAAAAGSIVPSGTQSVAAAYRLRFGGVASNEFTIPVGAIAVNDVLRAAGNATNAVLEMPVIATYTIGTVTATPDGGNTGDGTCATLSATASTSPGTWNLECTAAATDAGTFKLVDPDGTVISTTVAVSGSPQTVGGITFTLTDGAADFIVGDTFAVVVPATALVTTTKWKGLSANRVVSEVIGDTTLGTSFAITQVSGGLVDPTLDAAIAQIAESDWETMAINALDPYNTTALDTLATWGEGQWGQFVHKPCLVFRGNGEADQPTACATTATRTTDRTNFQLVSPGDPNMPHVIAAAQVAKIAVMANATPPHGYGGLRCDSLLPGLPSQQWSRTVREAALAAGSSTVEIQDGKVIIGDVISSYAPVGQPNPAYRFAVDIVKLQNVHHNVSIKFSTGYRSAPLIADADATIEATAKKPRMLKMDLNAVLEALGQRAILANVAATKKTTAATILGPRSVQLTSKVTLSGNVDQISVDLVWGFLFG